MIRSSIRVGIGRRARRLGAFAMTAALLTRNRAGCGRRGPVQRSRLGADEAGARRRRRLQLGRCHDLGVRPNRLRRLARIVPGALFRFGLVQRYRDQQRSAQSERTDDAGQAGRLPRDLFRVPADGLRPDPDRLHRVRQRRDVAGQEGPDVPDHGSRPLVGRHGVPTAVRHGRARHDRDHPVGQ